jgi:hypothetical protein
MTINEKVDVGFNNYPRWVKWKNNIYKVEKLGLHHAYREGKTLYHIFSVTTATLFMRLKLDTDNLSWFLEEIEDKSSI